MNLLSNLLLLFLLFPVSGKPRKATPDVPLEQSPRVSDEVLLITLLDADLDSTNNGIINKDLRKHINEVAKRLAKDK